jgi:hypothetical protein
VFNFDPATGAFTLASQSFGSGFAERALTNGKGRFGFGVNFQHLTFSSYEGVNLQNGDLTYVLQHNDCCAVAGTTEVAGASPKDPAFEGDLVEMQFSVNLKTDVVAPFVSYGLTNRWDVGLVVPIVRVNLNPSVTSILDRVATCPTGKESTCNIHTWDGVSSTVQKQNLSTLGLGSGTASGIGDVVLRTKYRFFDGSHGGLAGDLDLRLPTGDRDNLLGTGAVQAKLLLIASGEYSRFAPHVNVGYTFSHGNVSTALTALPSSTATAAGATAGQLASETGVSLVNPKVPNEIDYVAGFDLAAHSLVTVSADFVGRTLRDTERFAIVPETFSYRTTNGGSLQSATRNTFDTTSTGSLSLLLGVIGAKVNIPGTSLLLTGSVLFPLNDAGLRPGVTPVIGLDYSFKR